MKNVLKKIFGGFAAILAFLLIAVAGKKNVKRFDDTIRDIYDKQQR